MLVGELESRLLEFVPADAAESWDRTGMLVGDPLDEVTRVAVALDPNMRALEFARDNEANVLLTHHPLFLDPPTEFRPEASAKQAPGLHIWKAIELGISIISFHTALDANPVAARAMSELVGIEPTGELLEAHPSRAGFGYGRICDGEGLPLSHFADACEQAFQRKPRVWGDASKEVRRACLWTGAAGEAPAECLERGVDLLICGEVNYHRALDASELGLGIIELGHDASEQVFCPILVELAQRSGIDAKDICMLELPGNWR